MTLSDLMVHAFNSPLPVNVSHGFELDRLDQRFKKFLYFAFINISILLVITLIIFYPDVISSGLINQLINKLDITTSYYGRSAKTNSTNN